MSPNSQGKGDSEQRTPWLEWVASGCGLVLAVCGIGYILWDGITGGSQPPAVQVEVRRTIDRQPGYTVEIRATNRSGTTAASVVIQGELQRDGQTVETSETTFDYIPGRSERRGGIYFDHDPRQMELIVRALGYAIP